jgi:hypothetical protein
VAEVDPDALQSDANDHWQPWSLKLESWKTTVQDLSYTRDDFSIIPGSDDVYSRFGTACDVIGEYLHTGEEIFEGFARALLSTAIEYMAAEGDTQEEIAKVEQEMEQL